ncbi:Gfo/Idh/MocA family protein [Kineococcus sp. TBRC 1896]|uniref:Gfo/Idh/MocA family protein n=1 Tax=Kineococcus mangrovi TaxID=1660183 RepID=A0ABV4HZL2_9ACTN
MLPTTLPDPELFTSGSGEPALRWGVLGPGWIAGEFVTAMRKHTAQLPVAVGSRSAERAGAFAAQHGMDRSHGSYEALVADPEVDVVYIATPQSEHLKLGLLALAAGKHVMIEKPLAMNATETRELVDAAHAADRLLMEAMWFRYLPQASVIRTLLADGVLGTIHGVHAEHGQPIPFDPAHRLYRPELGGGAMLDLGIYPVQLDSMVLGAPQVVTATGGRSSTGVDAFATVVLGHGDGVQSTLTTTLLARTPNRATIFGDQARIEMSEFFYTPSAFRLLDNSHGGAGLEFTDPSGLELFDGLSWEATALARYVGEGRRESPLHTLAETVEIAATMDAALAQF